MKVDKREIRELDLFFIVGFHEVKCPKSDGGKCKPPAKRVLMIA
jgi:hypothetical protein